MPSYIFVNEGNIFTKKNKKRIFPKFNEFPEIYDVQILTVICIHYWSVNVWRERKASVNKKLLICIYYNKDVHIS